MSHMPQRDIALFLVIIMLSGPISGCINPDSSDLNVDDLMIDIPFVEGGYFQDIELKASTKMSVFIPYLILDEETGFVQNSTVVDLIKNQVSII